MCEYTRLPSYKKEKGYDFEAIFKDCKILFKKSDYVVANLETPVAGEELKYSYRDYSFNTPEEILYAIKSAGIHMVSTANNHVLDRGIAGIDRTIENIRKYGIAFTGSTHSAETPIPQMVFIHGVKIGFLSYTYGTEACYNLEYLSKQDQYRVNLLQNQELSNPLKRNIILSKAFIPKGLRKVAKTFSLNIFKQEVGEYKQKDKTQKEHILYDIQTCKNAKCDLIIMCLHSGGQFNDEPTEYTRKISQFLFDSGVNIIIGNHEHVIQPAIFSEDKKIAYCLGNFSSNYGLERKPFNKNAQCSIVLHLTMKKNKNMIDCQVSFSNVISMYDEQKRIVTRPLYNVIVEEYNESRKKELEEINTDAYCRFTGKRIEYIDPQPEYKWPI